MNIKPEHQIYTQNFESKTECKNYIKRKIKLVQEDADELRRISFTESNTTYNSVVVRNTEDAFEQINQVYKDAINKLEDLMRELR